VDADVVERDRAGVRRGEGVGNAAVRRTIRWRDVGPFSLQLQRLALADLKTHHPTGACPLTVRCGALDEYPVHELTTVNVGLGDRVGGFADQLLTGVQRRRSTLLGEIVLSEALDVDVHEGDIALVQDGELVDELCSENDVPVEVFAGNAVDRDQGPSMGDVNDTGDLRRDSVATALIRAGQDSPGREAVTD